MGSLVGASDEVRRLAGGDGSLNDYAVRFLFHSILAVLNERIYRFPAWF